MTVNALLEEAFAHHGAGRLEPAEALYQQVLLLDRNNLNALQLLGVIASDAGRHEEAVSYLEKATAVLESLGGVTAQHAVLYHNLGNALVAAGRPAAGLASYRRGLVANPDMPELNARLAAVLSRQGDLAGAAAAFEASLATHPGHPEWFLSLADVYVALAEPERATKCYRRLLAHQPDNAAAQLGLGLTLISQGHPEEAIAPLLALVAAQPYQQSAHHALGCARFAAGQLEAAAGSFHRALALRPDDAESCWMAGRVAEARRDLDAAEIYYRRALDLAPALPGALFDLGTMLYRERGEPAKAIALFDQLLLAAPEHVGVHCARGNAFRGMHLVDEALSSYQHYLSLVPDSALAHLRLGETLVESGRLEEAVAHLLRSLALHGGHNMEYLAHVDLGHALSKLGRDAESLAHFRRAVALEPVATHRAAKPEADFSALLIVAPSAYNTPYEFLTVRVPFESHVLLLLPDQQYDSAFLASKADVAVNLVSDVDHDNGLLPVAAALLDSLGIPVINHPSRIHVTDRLGVAGLLADIPSCRVARIERKSGRMLSAPGSLESLTMQAPFLARLTGCHGGDDFELVETEADLHRLVSVRKNNDYFLIEYLDYRSADGYFRKYRFFIVGDSVLPYHLAIGAEWKVHHFRTDMANQAWMRQEEEAFLRAPEAVFEPRHFAALRTIRDRVGLEFFGVDCGLDRNGDLVVFEANATMLIHGDTGDFAYKNPYVEDIKSAFGALLARAAQGHREAMKDRSSHAGNGARLATRELALDLPG